MVSKKQKLQNILKSNVVFFIVLIFIVVGLFAILSPKVSSLLFPFKRQLVLNDFINKTKMTGIINPQDYWKFREFYSPGFFTFSKEGIAKSLSKNAEKEIGIDYNEKAVNSAFLFFSSRWLNSLDMLTKQMDLTKIVDVQKIPKNNIIFMSKNCLIYKSAANTIKITFLLSDTDMQKVSGISDYQNSESIKGEYWFNVTSVKIN